jgi:hypothetical protein
VVKFSPINFIFFNLKIKVSTTVIYNERLSGLESKTLMYADIKIMNSDKDPGS